MSSTVTVLEFFIYLFVIGATLRFGGRFADSCITNIKEMFSHIKSRRSKD